MIIRLLIIALLAAGPAAPAAAGELPRRVLGIWMSGPEETLRSSDLHRFAEMPLNHLGLDLAYHDLADGLPGPGSLAGLRGILVWTGDDRAPDPAGFCAFIEAAVAAGVPVAVFGPVPGEKDMAGTAQPDSIAECPLRAIGIAPGEGWRPYAHDLEIAQADLSRVAFERKLVAPFPVPDMREPAIAGAQAWLTLESRDEPGRRTAPVIVTPRGGAVAHGYTHWVEPGGVRAQWRIDPFAFFAAVFATDALPKPDVTTLSGRRIYYSHIDGDGWLNASDAAGYADTGTISARVILEQAIAPFPDLPVTVAPIAAELDTDWLGTAEAQAVARELFALPQVEPASHTYTHPFDWSFYGPGYRPEAEAAFAGRFPMVRMAERFTPAADAALSSRFAIPRAYGDIPFDLDKEIAGAARFIERFAPPGKPVRLVQWSGDTSPFEAAFAALDEAGLLNINGGDTRFDGDFASYTTVAPIGRAVGPFRQIYASHANENLYTDLWLGRFYGFRFLQRSWANTDTPRRVQPMNLYYHMYSGEKEAALRALKENIAAAQTAEITPIATSTFAAIANGFYSTRILETAPGTFEIRDRGALQTIRFDGADALHVDHAASRGVIGWRRRGASLYVALDPREGAPVIATRDAPVAALNPFLVHARWRILGFESVADRFALAATGYGPGAFSLAAEPGSEWIVAAQIEGGPQMDALAVRADAAGTLDFVFPRATAARVIIEGRRAERRAGP